jgi:hypothetical protein
VVVGDFEGTRVPLTLTVTVTSPLALGLPEAVKEPAPDAVAAPSRCVRVTMGDGVSLTLAGPAVAVAPKEGDIGAEEDGSTVGLSKALPLRTGLPLTVGARVGRAVTDVEEDTLAEALSEAREAVAGGEGEAPKEPVPRPVPDVDAEPESDRPAVLHADDEGSAVDVRVRTPLGEPKPPDAVSEGVVVADPLTELDALWEGPALRDASGLRDGASAALAELLPLDEGGGVPPPLAVALRRGLPLSVHEAEPVSGEEEGRADCEGVGEASSLALRPGEVEEELKALTLGEALTRPLTEELPQGEGAPEGEAHPEGAAEPEASGDEVGEARALRVSDGEPLSDGVAARTPVALLRGDGVPISDPDMDLEPSAEALSLAVPRALAHAEGVTLTDLEAAVEGLPLLEAWGEEDGQRDGDVVIEKVPPDVALGEREGDGEADEAGVGDCDTRGEREGVPEAVLRREKLSMGDGVGDEEPQPESEGVRDAEGDALADRLPLTDAEKEGLPDGVAGTLADGAGLLLARADDDAEGHTLVDCDGELERVTGVAEPVGERLGEPEAVLAAVDDAVADTDGLSPFEGVKSPVADADFVGNGDAEKAGVPLSTALPDGGGEPLADADTVAVAAVDVVGVVLPVDDRLACVVALTEEEPDRECNGERVADAEKVAAGLALRGPVAETHGVGEPEADAQRVGLGVALLDGVKDCEPLDDAHALTDGVFEMLADGQREALAVAHSVRDTVGVALEVGGRDGKGVPESFAPDAEAMPLPLAEPEADAVDDKRGVNDAFTVREPLAPPLSVPPAVGLRAPDAEAETLTEPEARADLDSAAVFEAAAVAVGAPLPVGAGRVGEGDCEDDVEGLRERRGLPVGDGEGEGREEEEEDAR